MSTTDSQLLDLAKYVINHDALDKVKERVDLKMLARFRKGNPAEREAINAIMDNDAALLTELKTIIAENAQLTGEDDE